jgi:hypothetical protein
LEIFQESKGEEEMKVKVEFEAIVAKKEQHRYLVELPGSEHDIGVEEWIPAHLCTPILPDFGEGDLVEHVPSGARGVAKMWSSGMMLDSEDRALCIEVPQRPTRKAICFVFWPAADCHIVRKAGETE